MMDMKSTTSLQDRIKALNLTKIPQAAPRKSISTNASRVDNSTPNITRNNAESDDSTYASRSKARTEHQMPAIDVKKSDPLADYDSGEVDDLYVTPKSNQAVASSTRQAPPADEKRTSDFALYSDVPNDQPLQPYHHNGEQSDPDRSLCSDVPTNQPLEIDAALPNRLPNESSLYATPNDIPVQSLTTPTGVTASDTGYYATPSDFPVAPDGNVDRTILPAGINSRWSKIRKTINDQNLRAMVDMSELHKNNAGNDDVILSPNAYKRSHSVAVESLSPKGKEDNHWKRPSLPAMFGNITEEVGFQSPSSTAESPPAGFLTPEHGVSRESSYKSTTSGTFSDISETPSTTSFDFQRGRNLSDVSITRDEYDYMSFETINNGSNDWQPNERTLVVVRGDTAITGTLTLVTEEEEVPRLPPPDAPYSPSRNKNSENEPKRQKGKGIKGLTGKLAKVIKNKKHHSPTSPKSGSPRSVPQSPAKFMTSSNTTSPFRAVPQSPVKRSQRQSTSFLPMMPPSRKESLQQRHMSQSSVARTPPSQASSRFSYIPSLASRPQSMCPLIQQLESQTEMDGVYYDPSRPHDGAGDTLTVEVFEEGNDRSFDLDYNGEYCDANILTAQKRSQSLASLHQDYLDTTFVDVRRFSGSLGELRRDFDDSGSDGIYMDACLTEAQQIQPEKKVVESDCVTSLSSVTSHNDRGVKLRNKKNSRPGGRPPSMPGQLPPNPPRPCSMPSDEPPDPDEAQNDENMYVSPAVGTNQESGRNSGVSIEGRMTPPQTYTSEYPNAARVLPSIPVARTTSPQKHIEMQNDALSPANAPSTMSRHSSEEDSAIYYTVDDPPSMQPFSEDKTKPFSTGNEVQSLGTYVQNSASIGGDPENHGYPITQKQLISAPRSGNEAEEDTETPPHLLPRQSSIKLDVPEKPKPSVKPAVAKKPSVQGFETKPLLPNKPGSAFRRPPPPKLPPKPGSAVISNKPAQETGETGTETTNSVVPPPRPSKARKFSAKCDEIQPGENVQLSKLSPSSSAIAELGKLISMGGPMSPRLLKSAPQSPKQTSALNVATSIPEPQADPDSVTPQAKDTPHLKGPSRPPKPPPVAKSPSVDLTAASQRGGMSSRSKPEIIVMKNTLQTTVSDNGNAPTAVRMGSRNPPKRPNVAPPPRPTAPPPPPPGQAKSGQPEKNASKPVPFQAKASPPSRPPPPSSDKIKAAEERKRLQRLQAESFEDEYNDSSIRHEGVVDDEDNTYADIDDHAFSKVRKNVPVQQTIPTPPPRPKHTMRKAVQSITSITNMKKFGRQKKSNAQKAPERQAKPLSPVGIYNGVGEDDNEEEAVYAGIDD